jgi:hypothetical protein
MSRLRKSEAFNFFYALTVWITIYGIYLKVERADFVMKYSYVNICTPLSIISIIYLVELYFNMIKSKIRDRWGNKAE